jgi:hypothetical protein
VLTWIDDDVCTVGDTEFVTLGHQSRFLGKLYHLADRASTPERFVLFKFRSIIDEHVRTLEALRPERIVELGVFRGGSTALLAALLRPKKLVAIEYERERVPALDEFLASEGLEEACRVHHGVDQADVATVGRILDDELGDEPLDFVLDDASHFAGHTRASFNLLFPRLRPGGVYTIEDWSWNLQGIEMDGEPMEELVYELVRAAGRGPGLIAGMTLGWNTLSLTRGPAELGSDFAVEEWSDRPW